MANIVLHANDKATAVDFASLSEDKQKFLREKLKGGAAKTRVLVTNNATGEVQDLQNKVVITGSQINACSMFGLDPLVKFPTYNTEMNLDNSDDPSETPKNDPIVCLFCISDSGCGTLPKDIKTSTFTDRIKPAPANPSSTDEFTSDMIMPFRYVDDTADLSDDLRKYYFGRKHFTTLGKIGYYFKTFDTEPQLHLVYADGTDITEDMYKVESTQTAECYVEMRLRITRVDFRDYFENALGWDKARISSLSLCLAWYDDTIDQYVYYQDILPYTILNFSFQQLAASDISLDILYQIYY